MHPANLPMLAEPRSSNSTRNHHYFHRSNFLVAQEGDRGTTLIEDNPLPPQVRRIAYRSITELKSLLQREDHPDAGFCLSVVIQLDDQFNDSLPDLVARRHLAMRLIVTTPSGTLRGPHSKGDLAMCAGSLGWHMIVCRQQSDRELDEALTSLAAEDACMIFYPASGESAAN